MQAAIDSLQKQIDELKKSNQVQPTIGGVRATMKVFGRIHLDFWTFPSSDDAINVFENADPNLDPLSRIEFRRARFGFQGKIEESMLYKVEIDFGKPNSLAFKDMYIGFEDLPVVQTLLIGNQKRPYGLDALNSSRFNVFIERPFIIDAFNLNARRLGLAAYGYSKNQAWNWRYGVWNMVDWSETGRISSYTVQPEFAGRIAHTPWFDEESGGRNYAHVALSGTMAFPDGSPSAGDAVNEARFRTRPEARSGRSWIATGRIAGTDRYAMSGLETVLNVGSTQVTGEYMHGWLSRADGQEDLQFHGGYVYVAQFLTGEFMPWNRKNGTLGRIKPSSNFGAGGWGALQVAARYSYADFSDKDVFGGVGQSLTLGLNWYWNPNARLQFNYINGRISDRNVDLGGQNYSQGDYEVLGLRVMVDF